MTNLLRQAAETLQTRMEANASEVVTYIRNGAVIYTGPAVIGRSITEQDSGSGFFMKVISRDFIIRQSNLPGLVPMRNDEVRQMINDVEVVFLVDGSAGQPHYEETDGYGVAWRIHTKRNTNG
jgi:hypothetical protein